MSLQVVSLFAGIGGFEEAACRAGIPTIASVEIDPAARGVIADHFPHTTLFNDVREVTGDQLRAAGFMGPGGIITAGFPCQDLSVAGRRAGLAGARSGLFHEIPRLAAETGAEWLLLENVPGLLSSHGGRDMGAVLRALVDIGYRLAWRVLDAQHFGVPQRRRRVFIVASAGDRADPGEVLFEPEGGGGDPTPRPAKGAIVAALTANRVGTCGADDNQGQAGHLIPATFVKARRAGENDLSPESWRASSIAPTVDACGHGPRTATAVLEAHAVRRLTPLECERLQGFPDHWTATSNGKPQFDSARYRQIGNAVAVPVAEWILHRLHATHHQQQGVAA